MTKKILIFGATGAVGSSLAKLFKESSTGCHLIGKNEEEVSRLSDETGYTYSTSDVLEDNFLDKIEKDLGDNEISGIAYCVGSIDLKPINLISKKDILKCFSLNLFLFIIVVNLHSNLNKRKEVSFFGNERLS